MSPFKVTVSGSDSLVKALALMLQGNVEKIPVLEDNKVADLFREISGALFLEENH